MDDVAAEARVAKGTIYLYCQGKEDLYRAAIEQELWAWKEDLASFIDPQRPANEILAEMGRRDAAFIEERPLVARLLTGMIDDELPAHRSELAKLRSIGISHVIEVLRLGIRQGVFASDLDITATARILQEMQLVGALLPHRSGLPIREIRKLQTAALRLVLLGLESRVEMSR